MLHRFAGEGGGPMSWRMTLLGLGMLAGAVAVAAQQSNPSATHTLKATPKTIAWGYYDASAAPVLRVKSGESVEIQTLITSSPKRLSREMCWRYASLPCGWRFPMRTTVLGRAADFCRKIIRTRR